MSGGGRGTGPVRGAAIAMATILVMVFYVLPEASDAARNGLTPHGSLSVRREEHTPLREILAEAWSQRRRILNPVRNPLTRFFLVTMLLGAVCDLARRREGRA